MFPYRGFVIRLGCDRGVLLSGRCAFSRGWGREGARVGVGCVLLRKTSGAPGREGCFGEGRGGCQSQCMMRWFVSSATGSEPGLCRVNCGNMYICLSTGVVPWSIRLSRAFSRNARKTRNPFGTTYGKVQGLYSCPLVLSRFLRIRVALT